MAHDDAKIVHDERVGARVNPETGEVLPPEGEPEPSQKMAKGHDAWGNPLSPYPPEVLDPANTGVTAFQPSTVAPALSDAEFAAVQRANRGDADRDNPAVLEADKLRRGEAEASEKVAPLVEAAEARAAEDAKAREEKRAAEAAKAEVPLGATATTETTASTPATTTTASTTSKAKK